MIKVLIVDDEELARGKIKRFLRELKLNANVREAANGLEAVQALRLEAADLVFLDIEMPGMNGLEVLQNIEARPFKLIFQTAYDEFALKAFAENACDYLLKPFDLPRFQTAVKRALEHHENERKLSAFEAEMLGQNRFLEKITVKLGDKLKIIGASEIDYLTSQDHYTFIHTSTGEYLSELSLNFLEERLDPKHFVRIHRNSMIRVDRAQSLCKGPQMQVEMVGGTRLSVARARRATLRQHFS